MSAEDLKSALSVFGKTMSKTITMPISFEGDRTVDYRLRKQERTMRASVPAIAGFWIR